MPSPTTAELLKYADLQMAAEAFLRVNKTGDLIPSGSALIDALKAGNGHTSRFTEIQATEFAAHWEVLDQKANTSTGFSGTLFRNKDTNELVMSFRSTEFIDDAARDNQATNSFEIKDTGFAWGQLSDMESWYAELKTGGKLPVGANFSVTGYSLGGHLATAFNLLHPDAAQQVVTFNGAGVGKVKFATDTLEGLLQEFKALRDDPSQIDARFTDPQLREIYQGLRDILAPAAWNLAPVTEKYYLLDQAQSLLDGYTLPSNPDNSNPQFPSLVQEKSFITDALKEIRTLVAEAERVGTLVAGGTGANATSNPVRVADQDIDAENLDYRMAVKLLAQKSQSASMLSGAQQALGSKVYLDGYEKSPKANQFDIVGDSSPSMVSNSQWHIGKDVRVFIEDQPLYRGGVGAAAVNASLDYGSIKLLVNNYVTNDFGDTHSLVLLVDSLNVQNTLLKLFDQGQQQDAAPMLKTILKNASNLRKEDGDLVSGNGQGKAEGNVLENVLNALGGMLVGSTYSNLKGNTSGNTWAELEDDAAGNTGRKTFYLRLKEIQTSAAYVAIAGQAIAGHAKLVPAPTNGSSAREDFGALLSLVYLAPFAIKFDGEVPVELRNAQQDLYADWTHDKDLAPELRSQGQAAISDQYLEARAQFLARVTYYNEKNARYDTSTGGVLPQDAEAALYDHQSPDTVWSDQSTKIKIQRGGVTGVTRYVVFGGQDAEADIGGGNRNDQLFGGGGGDTLSGNDGDDYLQGDGGDDILIGGAGNDTLAGGKDSDTYQFTGSFGKDTILDSDGMGKIKIDGQVIGDVTAAGRRDAWRVELASGQVVEMSVYDDARSSTGKKLVITRAGSTDNTITVNNFNLDKAKSSEGYLGIKLENDPKPVLKEGGGVNVWAGSGFNPASLAGRSSDLIEGAGKTFTIYLNIAAKADESLVLSLAGLAGKGLKAILGDSKVDADGATITLAEGQTEVSFALVQEGQLDADAAGAISVSYQGAGQSVVGNTWGLNIKDLGEITKTFNGDQHGRFLGSLVDNGVTIDYYASTEWAADGQVIDGEVEEDFNDVIVGSTGNDKVNGKGGNDALDGGAGNDEIDGGAGDDVIIGGAGSDTLNGGAGNDYIFGAADLVAPQTLRTHGWSPTQANAILAETSDDAPDVIDAGDGNDMVFAGRGGDRIEGGAGNDQLWGLAGDDIIEGGTGDDALYGDGINAPGSHATTQATEHGNDFLDGGDGDDVILGYGKDDSLFGGAGNDSLWGDAAASTLAGEYHGNDYLDGEDGDDRLWGNGGNDTLYGGDGNDQLQGDASESDLAGEYHGDDYLDGEGGNDSLWGEGGNDTLYGGDGDDELSGDASDLAGEYHGDDYINGEDGNDFLWGGGGSDTLVGGAGDDEIYADTGGLISDAGYLAGEYHGDDDIDAGDGDDYAEGNGGNDRLKGGAGSDQLWGDAALVKLEAEFHGTDFLDGGDGDDYLTGGGKSDTLYGGAGNDLLWGDDSGEEGDDHYIPGSFHGDDYLDGGEGDDQLVGDGANDTLIGGAGKDKLFGDDPESRLAGEFHGEDYLDGGDGDDYAEGGGNDDTILGGKGDDILWGDADESKISLELHGDDYVDGGEGADKLYGGGGDDILLGGDGNDTLQGDAGDDRLEGGAGDDILMGGDGDDILIDTEGNNTFDGGAGDDTITVGDQDNNLQGGDGNDILIAGDGDNTLSGGLGADQLTAGDGDNTMSGDEGNDTLTSGSGNDTLGGGEGNDVLLAGDGNNTLSGDQGNDTITAGSGNDILNGGEGNDSLSAGDGDNTLNGDQGSDTMTAGSGNDTLNGGEGNDMLSAGNGNNTLLGGNGNDSLASGTGVDNLSGGYGNDTLHSGGGNDVLNGGDGDDMLYGEGGNDVLYASRGNDTLAGGDGLDTYVLNYSADRSKVVDNSVEGSVVKLGAAGMKFEDLYATRRANDLVVEVRGTSASMRIKDYYASTQTSWVFEDAQGNTTTGEALVAASQTDWAQLQANLLKDFQSSALGSISRGYSDGGYTQRVDGSWYRAASYEVDISKAYVKRTELFKDLSGVITAHVAAEEWSGDLPSQPATDTTATVTFQTNAVADGTTTLQSYNYAFNFENAWSSVNWTKDPSSHFESDWNLVYDAGLMGYIGYTRVDIDTDYYTGKVNQLTFQDPGAPALAGNLPSYVAVDFWHRQDSYNLGLSILADGDQTVSADGYSAVIGGTGNNIIYGAGFAYGGTGNAQLIGGGTLMAGTGDQLLQFGQTMVVGDGHDTVVGHDSSHILVNPDNLGIDLIGQSFDWESDLDNFGQSLEIKAIYQAMGYEDWRKNYQYGGKHRLDFGEDFVGYFDSLEDARAAFVPSSAWPTFDEAMAYAFTTWRYVEPLTALYKTPYTTVEDPDSGLVASSYYAAHGITPTLLTANDFAALQPLLQAELLPRGIVSFGPGLSLADLTLSWGEAVGSLDGATHVTLDILWGTDQGIRIMMPRSGDGLNSVVQQFEFSDGTVSSLLDLIALAPPAPDLTSATPAFTRAWARRPQMRPMWPAFARRSHPLVNSRSRAMVWTW